MMQHDNAAVVTGAARGIGKATVEQFDEMDQYDLVVCLDVDDKVNDVADELTCGVSYIADVSDHGRIDEVIDDVENSSNIEAIVNNAGLATNVWIGDLEPQEWDAIQDVNLKGQYNVVKAAAPRMYEREHGYIVNISSGAGTKGSVSAGVHYSAAKGGVIGLTKGLAKQLCPYINVNTVVPGLIDTFEGKREDHDSTLWNETRFENYREYVLANRLGEPEEVASVITFLCSSGASYMQGSTVVVDGGSALGPSKEFFE